MRNALKAEETEQAIKSTVLGLIDNSIIDRVTLSSDDDATDEPSFYVTVYLRNGGDRPSVAKSIDIVKAMRDALFELGEDRFPHLSFSAPDDEPSEDTRPAE